MDIQTRKLDFLQSFLKIDNDDTIKIFEDLLYEISNLKLDSSKKEFTLEEFQKRILQSEEDFRNLKYKQTEEILEKYS